jgi:hypothetical protein
MEKSNKTLSTYIALIEDNNNYLLNVFSSSHFYCAYLFAYLTFIISTIGYLGQM